MKKLLGIILIIVNLFIIGFVVTNLSSLLLFLFVIFIASLLIFSYGGYARQEGWRMGLSFSNHSSFLMIISIITIFASSITSFFFIEWYWVLFGVIFGWLLSGGITAIFKERTQFLSLLLFILSLLFGIILLVSKLIF